MTTEPYDNVSQGDEFTREQLDVFIKASIERHKNVIKSVDPKAGYYAFNWGQAFIRIGPDVWLFEKDSKEDKWMAMAHFREDGLL